MNEHYETLVTFLEKTASDVEQCKELLTGEKVPFGNISINKDMIWSALVSENENDADTVEILMLMCSSVGKLLKEKVKDHLPGGNHSEYDLESREKLRSVRAHNKLPEWIFGYLDWILNHRPNATRICNEAHLMFMANKTMCWLSAKDETEINKLVEWSKIELKQIKQTETSRLQMLREELEKISKQKEERAKEIEAKLVSEKENLTKGILKIGLWENEIQVDLELSKIKGLKKKADCLKLQLKFRNTVLNQQVPDKTLYQTTKIQGKSVTLDMLVKNLKTILALDDSILSTSINSSEITEE